MVIDMKQRMLQEVEMYERLGNACLITRLCLMKGVIRPGRALPEGYSKLPNKECFSNAAKLSQSRPGLTYVEGLGISAGLGLLIHHAWCQDAEGGVVDPTWQYPHESVYCGVAIPDEVLTRQLLKNRYYGLFSNEVTINAEFIYSLAPELRAIAEDVMSRPRGEHGFVL